MTAGGGGWQALCPPPAPPFLSGTKLFITRLTSNCDHEGIKLGRNTKTETCFVMGKAGVSLVFRIWGKRLQRGWRVHAPVLCLGGAPHVGGPAVGCQEELELGKGRLDIQPLYHVRQYQLLLLDTVWKWLEPLGPREPPATSGPIIGQPGARWLTHGQHCCPLADPVSVCPLTGVCTWTLMGRPLPQRWCWSSQMHSWAPEAVAAGWCQSHSHLAVCGNSCLRCELYLLLSLFVFAFVKGAISSVLGEFLFLEYSWFTMLYCITK